jgi:hypothetical protein
LVGLVSNSAYHRESIPWYAGRCLLDDYQVYTFDKTENSSYERKFLLCETPYRYSEWRFYDDLVNVTASVVNLGPPLGQCPRIKKNRVITLFKL